MTIETEKELEQRNQKVTDIVHKYAASFGGDLPLECQGVTAQEILEMQLSEQIQEMFLLLRSSSKKV